MRTNARRSSTAIIASLCFLIFVVLGQGADCIPPPQQALDSDMDGIPDDGDRSGVAGDNPCTGGDTTDCDDNCPQVANADQADGDGDGFGDACDPQPAIPFVGPGTGGGGGGGGGTGGGNGDGPGGSGPASQTVYLGEDASLLWTVDPCESSTVGSATATSSVRAEGSQVAVRIQVSAQKGTVSNGFEMCTFASEFTVMADPNDPEPAGPRSAPALIIYDLVHIATLGDAAGYWIGITITVPCADPSFPGTDTGSIGYSDIGAPNIPYQNEPGAHHEVPVILQEGQTCTVEVRVGANIAGGIQQYANHGGSVDFDFQISNPQIVFGEIE